MALGLDPDRAHRSAYNGRGPWWKSGASHMNQAIPLAWLRRRGLMSSLDQDQRLKCTSCTAVYGPVRTVVREPISSDWDLRG